ncbi:hypothetical protein J2W25_001678 [Variovorax boronicumulans]|uniref:Uncharacterized protein n=1 Tax=Variovorax boronicumulans TaxID=436515 RepID=A0AAW8DT82_9BURK|nr:hypothetical protein [Variovorax boronicumulans]MDP9922657.1 hypothetical protein [Variovorax boronicumulans]
MSHRWTEYLVDPTRPSSQRGCVCGFQIWTYLMDFDSKYFIAVEAANAAAVRDERTVNSRKCGCNVEVAVACCDRADRRRSCSVCRSTWVGQSEDQDNRGTNTPKVSNSALCSPVCSPLLAWLPMDLVGFHRTANRRSPNEKGRSPDFSERPRTLCWWSCSPSTRIPRCGCPSDHERSQECPARSFPRVFSRSGHSSVERSTEVIGSPPKVGWAPSRARPTPTSGYASTDNRFPCRATPSSFSSIGRIRQSRSSLQLFCKGPPATIRLAHTFRALPGQAS